MVFLTGVGRWIEGYGGGRGPEAGVWDVGEGILDG